MVDQPCRTDGSISPRLFIIIFHFIKILSPSYAFFILLLSVYRKPVPASFVTHFCIQKGHLPKSASVPTIFFKITHLYSIKGIRISSVQTSFPYIMMIWKQWQPADMVKLSDFSPFWLCAPAFQQVCL